MSGPFARTVLGPAAPTGLDTNKGALIADVQNGVPEIVDLNGNSHGIETMLLQLLAQTALTTITTAQNLFSQTLPAGALNKIGRMLRITGSIVFTTASANTPTIAIALKLGTVTLCTITSAAVAASTTNGQLQFEIIVQVATAGSSGTIESHGELLAQLSATLGTALAAYADQNTAVSSAVNLTSSLALSATITASGGTVSSATLRQLTVEVIN